MAAEPPGATRAGSRPSQPARRSNVIISKAGRLTGLPVDREASADLRITMFWPCRAESIHRAHQIRLLPGRLRALNKWPIELDAADWLALPVAVRALSLQLRASLSKQNGNNLAASCAVDSPPSS